MQRQQAKKKREKGSSERFICLIQRDSIELSKRQRLSLVMRRQAEQAIVKVSLERIYFHDLIAQFSPCEFREHPRRDILISQ
jgi:hypothetical protein